MNRNSVGLAPLDPPYGINVTLVSIVSDAQTTERVMNRTLGVSIGLAVALLGAAAQAQVRPYIGFVYPAGGQQGTTFEARLGGQNFDDTQKVLVTGAGVSVRVVEFMRRMNNQEGQLLREQVAALKRAGAKDDDSEKLRTRIERWFAEMVQTPACQALSNLAFLEITIAPDAAPGPREIRLITARGVSNPLVFFVGQVPEFSRKPMKTALLQVLGKEENALRKRPEDEFEQRVTVPCVANGQIASGEINRYRFDARKGQRLVISSAARQLVPFVADAVPGWIQLVLTLYGPNGKEVAYNDDYRFQPDPLIYFEVPADGEYVLDVNDAIYRGREDFGYRVTIGELPQVTSIFPLGCKAGAAPTVAMEGWNLKGAQLSPPPKDAAPGLYWLTARQGAMVSNRVPFQVDTLPDGLEKEPNNDQKQAQQVQMPLIVNGRIDRSDDVDVFAIAGKAGEKIVAEVSARRLGSPLDSVLKITDAAGKLLAINDDQEDQGAGANTHHADSYLMFELPADGTYYIHLSDTARQGGKEFGYRLRLSAPQPDFSLRTVPSSLALRNKSTGTVTVYAIRKDGFAAPIKLGLKDPPAGFTALPVTFPANQPTARLTIKTDLMETPEPVNLLVEGRATVDGSEIVRTAVPAEDRMQAFLWRHLVPAEELNVSVYNATVEAKPKREAPVVSETKPPVAPNPTAKPDEKPKFTKQQVAGRLRELKRLYEDYLITEDFYTKKVAECEALK